MKIIRAIRLGGGDTCTILTGAADEGDKIIINEDDYEKSIIARECVPMWHKIAIKHMRAGGEVYKCGAVIGIATQNIAAGEYVHTHNVRSPKAGG